MYAGKIIKWYGDDTNHNWGKHDKIEDLSFFGGFAIPIEKEVSLVDRMLDVKAKYGAEAHHPIKWNLRDLNDHYRENDAEDVYQSLLANSKVWRQKVLQCLDGAECKIVVALVHAHGQSRQSLKENKDRVSGYAFKNALQRVGLLAHETRPERLEVVLDWPSKNEKKQFEDEYRKGFYQGEQEDYKCGALKDLRFFSAPMFCSMKESHLIQMADLVVGATKEFVASVLDGEPGDATGGCFKEILKHFRGAPHSIVGRGLSVAPATSAIRNIINLGVQQIQKN